MLATLAGRGTLLNNWLANVRSHWCTLEFKPADFRSMSATSQRRLRRLHILRADLQIAAWRRRLLST
eukprot:8620264-Karenia_brevis.AAC.1